MKILSMVSRLLLGISMTTVAAQAAVLLETTFSLTLMDPTQLGRLSRNAVAQDWTGSEAFPGAIDTTTSYYYEVFSVPNPNQYTYIQVDADSVSANTFASAYLGAYAPNSAGSPNFGFDTNWLGDAGSSGNSFGTDPIYFQVIIPASGNLLVVVNNTGAAGLGVGDSFHLTVEGFYDSEYDDTPAAPEPSTAVLLMVGLVAAGVGVVRRRAAKS